MKQLGLGIFVIVVAGIGDLAHAGYADCAIEPRFYRMEPREMIFFESCAVMADAAAMPSGIPTHITRVIFSGNSTKRYTHSRTILETLQPDLSVYTDALEKSGGDEVKLLAAQLPAYRKKIEELEKSWRTQGYGAFDFAELGANSGIPAKKYPSSILAFREYFSWPGSDRHLGWSINIRGGKIREPFSFFVRKANREEKTIPAKFADPKWTYAGHKRFRVYMSSDQKWILGVFDQTWSGIYLFETPSY